MNVVNHMQIPHTAMSMTLEFQGGLMYLHHQQIGTLLQTPFRQENLTQSLGKQLFTFQMSLGLFLVSDILKISSHQMLQTFLMFKNMILKVRVTKLHLG